MTRTVEVFTGAYASGKSETAINRALQYAKRKEQITLVDLDTVEPVYCIRPITQELKALCMDVVSNEENFGLGETGSYVTGEQLNCLKKEGDIIIDVGYGATGLDTLDVITGIEDEKDLRIYLVVNTSKFETKDVESILEYIDFSSGLNKKDWKKFSGLISNTHFADETTYEDIIRGYNILKEASEKAGIPIIAIGADEKFEADFDVASPHVKTDGATEPKMGAVESKSDETSIIQEADFDVASPNREYDGVPVWFYHRYMPRAFW